MQSSYFDVNSGQTRHRTSNAITINIHISLNYSGTYLLKDFWLQYTSLIAVIIKWAITMINMTKYGQKINIIRTYAKHHEKLWWRRMKMTQYCESFQHIILMYLHQLMKPTLNETIGNCVHKHVQLTAASETTCTTCTTQHHCVICHRQCPSAHVNVHHSCNYAK